MRTIGVISSSVRLFTALAELVTALSRSALSTPTSWSPGDSASLLSPLRMSILMAESRPPAQLLTELRATGSVEVPGPWRDVLAADFVGARLDDAGTLAQIAATHAQNELVVDPHTAVGLAAADRHAVPGVPMLTLATADPQACARARATVAPVSDEGLRRALESLGENVLSRNKSN